MQVNAITHFQINACKSITRPQSIISIFNTKIDSLCDTGASVSCINSKLMSQLQKQYGNYKFPLIPVGNVRISDAQGNDMKMTEKRRLPCRLSSGKSTFINAYVIENLSSDLLLGMDFLSSQKAVLDCQSNSVKYDTDNLSKKLVINHIQHTSAEKDHQMQKLLAFDHEMNQLEYEPSAYLKLGKETTIVPLSLLSVKAHIIQPDDLTRMKFAKANLAEVKGPEDSILNVVVSVENMQAQVKIINSTCSPKLISKSEIIGELRLVPANFESSSLQLKEKFGQIHVFGPDVKQNRLKVNSLKSFETGQDSDLSLIHI